jgi:hypothetical protein
MPTLPFGEYRPDVNELDGQHTRSLLNVVPRADGYGPWRALAAFTQALGAACRGLFYARTDDGEVLIFGGTSTKLYRLDNTVFSWTDVSRGGSTYTTLPATAQWQFAQFGNFVIAVQPNDNVQVYDLDATDPFDDLTGSPPDASYIAIVNRFVVLSGLTANPIRVQWSALGDATGWTAGTDSSDFQDLPDGGIARPVVGGEFGMILQDFAVRRMIFSPGSELIFQIDRIGKDIGILAPYSVATAGNLVFFLSPQGFKQADSQGGLTDIGRERVDRVFFEDWDASKPHLMMGVADPRSHKILWAYKSASNPDDIMDKGLVYDWLLKRFTPVTVGAEFVTSLSQPGLTLEALDALAPGAMSITGLADNGSGAIRVTVADTTSLTDAAHYTISGVGGAYADDANGTWEIDKINGTTFDLVGSAVDSQNVTGAANNGSGLIRLTVASTAAWSTGSKVVVASVGGTTEANGNWVVTVVDATHVDLQGSTFSNAWTSGGTIKDRYDSATDAGIVGGSVDAMTFPFDDIQNATLPNISGVDSTHKVGFFAGDNLEATLETPEQSGDGKRLLVRGFWPVTDSSDVRGCVSKRENLNATITYTNESTMNAQGFVPQLRSTRYTRGKIRIPSGTAWTFASGVRPEVGPDGEI